MGKKLLCPRSEKEPLCGDWNKQLHTGNNQGMLSVQHIQWPVQQLDRGCSVTAELWDSFRPVLGHSLSKSPYPVPPQGAIGVGSAFGGWSPREQGVL